MLFPYACVSLVMYYLRIVSGSNEVYRVHGTTEVGSKCAPKSTIDQSCCTYSSMRAVDKYDVFVVV